MPKPSHKLAAVRIVVSDDAAAAYARLQEVRRVVTQPAAGGRAVSTVRRRVPVREVYEFVIRAFLDREAAGEKVVVLYPPESARRRLAWIDADVKAELEEAARRLDVSASALFYTATRALIEGRLTPGETPLDASDSVA
jgi:hypothetical protein